MSHSVEHGPDSGQDRPIAERYPGAASDDGERVGQSSGHGGECASLCEAFQRTAAIDPDAVALRTPGDGVSITWAQYSQRVGAIAAGLAALGVRRGDTVGLMLTNRPEFHFVDTAAIHLGAVPYSIYNTNPPEQISHLLSNADTRVVVCETQYVDVLRRTAHPIEHLIIVDGPVSGASTLAEVEAAALPGFDFESTWRAVNRDDVLTLIYTSGTTGAPKGVELTHGNLLAELDACDQVFTLRFGDRITSYLPSAHIADRLSCHYTQLRFGVQVTCVSDGRAILSVLTDVRPTIWVAVPRIWEKLKLAIEMTLAADADAGHVAWALETGLRKVRCEQRGEPVSAELARAHRRADAEVLADIRAKFGFDELRWAMSGAASVAPQILEFFSALGVRVCEIWGMSETVGAATVNPPDRIKVGTVGKPLPGVELRIAEDGEALLRGPIVMRGYRKDAKRTADVLDADGWLSTGDVVSQDVDGYVTIVDRKKELIINSAGKNMSPSNIENAVIASCSLLSNVVVVGDGRPYNVALVVLDPDVTAAVSSKLGLEDVSLEGLVAHPRINEVVDVGIKAANELMSRVEQIKRFAILPEQWVPGGPFLTPTLKLKRRVIVEKYATLIDDLYAIPAPTTAP